MASHILRAYHAYADAHRAMPATGSALPTFGIIDEAAE
jgi:hypothetical protein